LSAAAGAAVATARPSVPTAATSAANKDIAKGRCRAERWRVVRKKGNTDLLELMVPVA
jgi:hypothetical protein